VGEKKTRRLVGRWKFSVSNTLVHIIENSKDLRGVTNFGEILIYVRIFGLQEPIT
jgi:hypothetical protein